MFRGFSILVLVVFTCCQSISAEVNFQDQDVEQQQRVKCKNDKECPSNMECRSMICQPREIETNEKRMINERQIATCNRGQLFCNDKINCGKQCDNVTDCPDGEDEADCIQICADCKSGQLLCDDINHCATQCNNVTECPGGEDELNCIQCADCPEGHLLCHDKTHCAIQCNGTVECPGGEDEINCTECEICEEAYALINKCVEYSDEWINIPEFHINLTPHLRVENETIVTCQAVCDDEPNCLSFDISTSSLYCNLHNIDPGEALRTFKFESCPDCNLYVRKCTKCKRFA